MSTLENLAAAAGMVTALGGATQVIKIFQTVWLVSVWPGKISLNL